eukprot:gene32939-66802_t
MRLLAADPAARVMAAVRAELGRSGAQIAFVPSGFGRSILAGMFPMHFGKFVSGPIHLYSHSFLRYGYVSAFQRTTTQLHKEAGVEWRVHAGQFGVSVDQPSPERSRGMVTLRGSSDYAWCRELVGDNFPPTRCTAEPCSILGVYQPGVEGITFHGVGEYRDVWTYLGLPSRGPFDVVELDSPDGSELHEAARASSRTDAKAGASPDAAPSGGGVSPVTAATVCKGVLGYGATSAPT